MTETNNDRALGRVEGKLDSLIAAVDAETKRAAENRAKVYERLNALAVWQASVDRRMADIETMQRDRILPFVERLEAAEQGGRAVIQAGGIAWRAARWAGGALFAGIVMFWREILDAIRGG